MFKVPYIFQAIDTAVKIYISWLLFAVENKQTNPYFGDPLKLIFLRTLSCLHCRTDYNNVQPFLKNLDFDTTCMELPYTNNVIFSHPYLSHMITSNEEDKVFHGTVCTKNHVY